MDAAIGGRHLTHLRTLGRGASGAVVSLASDDASGELFAVKAAAGAAGATQLRREGLIMSRLCDPHVLRCFEFGAAAGGGFELFLEFAPGGSIADEVARNGGRLEEGVIRAYAADVAKGLAYLHGESLVHGDVKGRNVVIGADGQAKLADFGCARSVHCLRPIGGTPAFMAPEVARGEEQGPAADVWALGCTIIEMATGRVPWSDMDDVVAAVRRIGYTEAVPEVPWWLSPEAKDFLDRCLRRRASERWTAAQLLEHPFVELSGCDIKTEEVKKAKWVSPKSTLDAALWESEGDEEEEDEMPESTAERIRELACPCSALPDWESDDGWIEVCSRRSEFCDIAVSTPAEEMHSEVCDMAMAALVEEMARNSEGAWEERLDGGDLFAPDVDDGDLFSNVRIADASIYQQEGDLCSSFTSDPFPLFVNLSDEEIVQSFFGQIVSVSLLPLFIKSFLPFNSELKKISTYQLKVCYFSYNY